MVSAKQIIESIPELMTRSEEEQQTLEEMLVAGRSIIQDVRPRLVHYLETCEPPAVMGALFYTTVLFVCEHSSLDGWEADEEEVKRFVDERCREFDVPMNGAF